MSEDSFLELVFFSPVPGFPGPNSGGSPLFLFFLYFFKIKKMIYFMHMGDIYIPRVCLMRTEGR